MTELRPDQRSLDGNVALCSGLLSVRYGVPPDPSEAQ
jgi:hypothetical protein